MALATRCRTGRSDLCLCQHLTHAESLSRNRVLRETAMVTRFGRLPTIPGVCFSFLELVFFWGLFFLVVQVSTFFSGASVSVVSRVWTRGPILAASACSAGCLCRSFPTGVVSTFRACCDDSAASS